MGRKILFITTDQQRYDSLGCNGGTIARTPVVDGLAARGVNFRRAQPSNVVCMPSRATMVTGQSIATHGVWMNGVPLPAHAPSVPGDPTTPPPRGHSPPAGGAERAIAWLDSLPADDDWFCWVSFPDPHHPWDPPASERHRVRWQDLDLPPGYPEKAAEREAIIDGKPRHWRLWYDGGVVANFEAPPDWVPATLTADQGPEIKALVHIANEPSDG